MSLSVEHWAVGPRVGHEWLDFIQGMLTDDWAIGSWNPTTGLLTIDPFNELNEFKVCDRPGCANPAARVPYCLGCRRGAKKAGLAVEEYALTYPKVDSLEGRSTLGFVLCEIHDEAGVRCGRAQTTRGLCPSHYALVTKLCRERDVQVTDDLLAAFIADRVGKVAHASMACAVVSCKRVLSRPNIPSGLCPYHQSGLVVARRSDKTITTKDFIRSDGVVERNQLPLRSLSEPMRTELLFVLQQYAARGYGRVMVSKLRPFINDARHDRNTDLLECLRTHDHAVRLKGVRTIGIQVLEKARRRFSGYDSLKEQLVYLQDLPLRVTNSHRNSDLIGAPLNIRELSQPWLADAFRAWLGASLEPRSVVQRCYAACVEASAVLRTKRSDRGIDATRLCYEDMAAILARFEKKWQPRAAWTYTLWWDLCRVARRLGVWDQIPESFAQNYASQKRATRRGRNDQKVESDRVTPAAVIEHISNHTRQMEIGRHTEMYRCVLELLMETGRRPSEITSLTTDCLVQDRHGGWLLRYTAHKTGGAIKELPVATPVVESISRWVAIRQERGIQAPYLFPTGRRRLQDINIPHISTPYLGHILTKFCESLPPVPGPLLDADGNPVNFDLTTVTPYDFRRAYAQRHADNGTDPDVLRQLMDHASMSTTTVYYQVSSKRRRQAVKALAPLAHDRHGRQVGIGDGRIQLKITPVPYGDCAEPSNVAAGGTACQLRYQCAGCGFFRPNPSHIPEIEKEILKLRSQLRISESSDTAVYLLNAQRGLIADYEKVLVTMRERLEQLPEDERREIDTMSEVMRRVRGAALANKRIELREM